jgi:predicted small lipoprotein YifL
VKRRVLWQACVMVLLGALATGCGKKVTVYEPGEYKGAKDPLLEQIAKPEHKTALKERFTEGQTER